MGMITCNECNIEKDSKEFQLYKKRDGTKGTRKTCRDCRNNKRRKTDNTPIDKEIKNKPEIQTIKAETKPNKNTKDDIKLNTAKQFTEEEAKKLKEIIKVFQENNNKVVKENKNTILEHNETIIKTISNRVNRVKATYNMDIEVKRNLSEYCNKTGLNNSDIVNIALVEFFKNKPK